MVWNKLKIDVVVRGPIFPEPVQVIAIVPMGASVKLIGRGLNDQSRPFTHPHPRTDRPTGGQPREGTLRRRSRSVSALASRPCAWAWPTNTIPTSRSPSPALTLCRTSLEAVYDYFIKLPRIRFLLADDPGAGKTIMAGLLLKELKIRGLVKRTLIVTPANLSFQWQRELKDKFRESFEVIRSDVLRANYGTNPWQDKNQVITSVSWVSRIEDAKESLLRSHWDLIIVDEAHKMSADSADKKTLAYQLGRVAVADDRPLSC